MSHLSSDRNLLFGILALQMDFVTRDVLIEGMNAWAVDKSKTLGRILADRHAIQDDEHQLLEALVGKHLERHGSDPARSLAALSHGGAARWAIGEIGSAEVLAALAVPETAAPSGENPLETRSPTVGPHPGSGTRFRILRPHARGGLGEVYLALDAELNREVALKEIQDRHADHPESRARFVQEAEITGGLEHPGIVPVYGLGHYDDGRPYYAMRFMRGDSLDDAITRFHQDDRPGRDPGERELGVRKLLGRFVDVCNAIAYAHSRGVLHRDIKPGNVMLGRYGETMVVDWGLAKPLGHVEEGTPTEEIPLKPSESGTAETVAGLAVGTPQYMSPEQAACRLDQLGPRSDVYSLGATLYTLLTGGVPFGKSTVVEVLKRVERGDFPPPRQINPKVAPGLQSICLKAMSLRPEDRYPTPRALAEDVERWLGDEPVSAHREGRMARSARWLRRNRDYAQAGALSLIAVTVVATASAVMVARSLQAESAARSQAEGNLRVASGLIDDISLLSQDPFLMIQDSAPILNDRPLREALLKAALNYNQKLLQENPGDDPVQADGHLRVGQITRQIGSKDDALAAYRQALAIRERLEAARPDDESRRRHLGESLIGVGTLLTEMGRMDESIAVIDRAVQIREKALADRPDDAQARSDLAEALHWSGDTLERRGDRTRSLEHLERSLTIRNRLADRPDATVRRSLELAQGHRRIGRWHQGNTDSKKARISLTRAIEILVGLAGKYPSDYRVSFELARSHHDLGLEQSIAQPIDAMKSLEESLAIRLRLRADYPAVTEFERDLAANHFVIANIHDQAGRSDQAISAFERSRTVLEPLVRGNPRVPEWSGLLAKSMMRLALLKRSQGRPEDALASCNRALEILRPFVDRNDRDVEALSIMSELLSYFGTLHAEAGQFSTALPFVEKGCGIDEDLARDHPAGYRRQNRTIGLVNLGVLQAKVGRPAEALRSIERARLLLASGADDDPFNTFISACVEAQLSRLIGSENPEVTGAAEAERRTHADRAVSLLRRAIEGGFRNFDEIRAEIGLEPLANRVDFQRMVFDPEFPEQPFAPDPK